ncbi:hypothetical protein O7609_04845 [Streptomyces sp. WMMC1477]|nr:hypothetical protein [Streptomyces sp. WMMC1477]MCZ7431016.1 hypothetical protein [Streptomyces sp. WMMC1477]
MGELPRDTVQQLHDEVGQGLFVMLGRSGVVDGDDAAVAQCGERAGLAREPSGRLRVLPDAGDELDGDPAAERGVHRLPHLAQPASSQEAFNPVAAPDGHALTHPVPPVTQVG